MNQEQAIADVFGLYEQYGTADYIGEPVSQLEHMSQAAQLAMAEGVDDEVVLAAFSTISATSAARVVRTWTVMASSAMSGWVRIIYAAQGSASAWPSWSSITYRPNAT